MVSGRGLLHTNMYLPYEGLIKTQTRVTFGENQQMSETGIERGRRNFVAVTYTFLALVDSR
jgi:hypothetical protein